MGLSHHHPLGAAGRARNQGVLHRRGSGEIRATGKRPPESRPDRSEGRRLELSGKRRRSLQRVLVRPRQQGRRNQADLVDRRSAQRAASSHDARRPGQSEAPRRDRARGAARTSARRHLGRPSALRALHSRSELRTADDARRLQQQFPAVPDPGHRGDRQRDDPRGPHHSDGRPPPSAHSAMEGRLARPLGGRHARRRHHEFQARDEPSGLERQNASDRALHPHRPRRAALRVHRRRSATRGRNPGLRPSRHQGSTFRSTNTPVTRAITP